MKETNVFICHNPFHFYISSQICRGNFAADKFENWIITSTQVSNFDPRFKYILVGSKPFEKLRSLWRIKNTIRQLAKTCGDKLQIFLPHIDGIIGNYTFESSFIRHKNVKINFYYEGIVMLDEERMSRKFPRFIRQKTILSLLLFHRFVKHPDILPMDSPRIHKIFTPYIEKTPAPEGKKVSISFSRENMKHASGTLIVGVDAGESLEESYGVMIEFLRKEENTELYFKPHYADRAFTFEKIATAKHFDFKLIQDTRCIEELIGELGVSLVICTHLSSALLNLKLIYKSDLRVIFLAHPKTISALGTKNVSFAVELGIELVNFNQI